MKTGIPSALLVGLFSATIHAASGGDRYAVKDAGLQACEQFSRARSSESKAYYLSVGWVSGYLTGYNQFAADTVDIAPWQSIDLLVTLLDNYCRDNPRVVLARAVEAMARGLAPSRLRTDSERIEARAGAKSVLIYREVMRRAQRKLTKLGHYQGEINGRHDEATSRAFKAYQRVQSISVTGLPDQSTLYGLLQ